jgi:hypothetical protein
MTDVAELGLKVSSGDVVDAGDRLDRLGKKAGKAETATGGLTSSFKKLIAPLAASVSLMAGFNKLTTISRQFDKFNASLITATGSAKNAEIAFAGIEKFASTTPYTLDQSVDAFTRLVNLGLTPSERALQAYGNTASAMGKDMTQLVEAVADATTGEFERLKEFGIKSKKEGDNVSFTFRGMTTTIGNSAAEIENYLIGLGENEFAGAMSERMKTLDGAIANLQDQWDGLFRTLSQQGSNDVMTKMVRRTTAEIKNLQDFIASGGLTKSIEMIGGKFSGLARDAKESLDIIGKSMEGLFNFMGEQGPGASNALTDAFKNFPENVRAFVRLGVVEMLSFFDKIVARATRLKEQVTNIFSSSGREAADKALADQLELIADVRRGSIEIIMNERDAAIASADSQIVKIQEMTTEYKALQLAKAEAANDDLAQFKIGGSAANIDQGGDLGEEKRNKIVEGLLLEEFAAQDQAERMQEIEQDKFKKLLDEQTRYTSSQKKLLMQMGKFEQMDAKKRSKFAIDSLTEMTGAFAGESRKAFEINKQLRTAQAIIDGIGAVQAAYAWGSATGGVIGGVAAAGAAALFTASQVRQIQSQEFSGGGSPTSVSVTPAAPYTSDTQTTTAPQVEQPINSSNIGDAPVNQSNVINIFDQSTGVSVETQQRTAPDGTKEMDLIIKDRVDDLVNTGELDETFALNYGLQRSGRGR